MIIKNISIFFSDESGCAGQTMEAMECVRKRYSEYNNNEIPEEKLVYKKTKGWNSKAVTQEAKHIRALTFIVNELCKKSLQSFDSVIYTLIRIFLEL